MPALPDLTQQALQTLQRQGSVLTSAELQAQLGVSQPTVSRALAPLIQSGQVQKVGAARSQRYVLPRTVRDVGRSVPVLRIDLHGQPSPFARMVPLAGGAVWIDEEDGLSKRFDGLPWFLDDMRPQGFMGRTFATSHPELQLGNDPRYWSDDDVLRALALCGDDLPGNLVVGEAAFARFHTLPPAPAAWPRQTPTPHWQTLPCRAAKADLRRAASSPSSARLLAATLRRAMCW